MKALEIILAGILLFSTGCVVKEVSQNVGNVVKPRSQQEIKKAKIEQLIEECQDLIDDQDYKNVEATISSSGFNDDINIKKLLASAYCGLGKFEELIDLIDKIKSEDPNYTNLELDCTTSSPEFNYGFGLTLFKKNRFKEALPHLKAAENNFSQDEVLLRRIAHCHFELQQYDEFENYCLKLLDAHITSDKDYYVGLLVNHYINQHKLPKLLPKIQSQPDLDNQIVRSVVLSQIALAFYKRDIANLFNNHNISSDLETVNLLYDVAEHLTNLSPKQNYPFVMKLSCLAYSIEFNLRFDNSKTLDEQKDLEKTAERLIKIYQVLINNGIPLRPLHDLYQINIIEFDLVNTASSSRNLGRACENYSKSQD